MWRSKTAFVSAHSLIYLSSIYVPWLNFSGKFVFCFMMNFKQTNQVLQDLNSYVTLIGQRVAKPQCYAIMRDFRLPRQSRREMRCLGNYAASSGNSLPKFRDNLRWPLQIRPIGCPETSVRDYHYTLLNIPEERSSRHANALIDVYRKTEWTEIKNSKYGFENSWLKMVIEMLAFETLWKANRYTKSLYRSLGCCDSRRHWLSLPQPLVLAVLKTLHTSGQGAGGCDLRNA
jgi:hypothetical protein